VGGCNLFLSATEQQETGDMLMGLEERKLVVWSEKCPSKVDFTAHKDPLFEKCMNFSENDQMGDPSSKQPSPMSVLDNTFFRDEETCTVITPRVEEEHILQGNNILMQIPNPQLFDNHMTVLHT
jgi:hypothetical protein